MFYPYKHFLKTLKQINLQKKVRIINRFQLNLTLIVFVTKPLKIGSWVSLRFWSAFNRPFILTVNLFARYYQVLMVDKVDKLCQSFFLLWEKSQIKWMAIPELLYHYVRFDRTSVVLILSSTTSIDDLSQRRNHCCNVLSLTVEEKTYHFLFLLFKIHPNILWLVE